MTLEEIFNDAALLVEGGWGRGASCMEGQGVVCLESAINLARGRVLAAAGGFYPVVPYLYYSHAADRPILDVVVDAGAALGWTISPNHAYEWNDAPGRTSDEVRVLLEKCRALAGERGL